jgi:endonuclease V-like protein UPF0215 family
LKGEVRVLGVDDGPFRFGDPETDLVGVVCRGAGYVENVIRARVHVDGSDATDRILAMVESCAQRQDLRAILLDGCTVAGFNVVDLESLNERAGIPVVAVTKGEPNWESVRAALFAHDAHADIKWAALSRGLPERMEVPGGRPLYVRAVGLGRSSAAEVLARTTVRGTTPEPLRLAHLIARAFAEPRGSPPPPTE